MPLFGFTPSPICHFLSLILGIIIPIVSSIKQSTRNIYVSQQICDKFIVTKNTPRKQRLQGLKVLPFYVVTVNDEHTKYRFNRKLEDKFKDGICAKSSVKLWFKSDGQVLSIYRPSFLNQKHVAWFLLRFVDAFRVCSLYIICKNYSSTFLLINLQKTKTCSK